jgi:predicted dehydrogenase
MPSTSVSFNEPAKLLVSDADYIGTPHTDHYNSARSALLAGKHVLLEKPVTCNAAELRSLTNTAKEYELFFMEAMWTRFLPTIKEFKKVVENGRLGDPLVMRADFWVDFDIHSQFTAGCFEMLTHDIRRRYPKDTQDLGSNAWRWRFARSVSVHFSPLTSLLRYFVAALIP